MESYTIAVVGRFVICSARQHRKKNHVAHGIHPPTHPPGGMIHFSGRKISAAMFLFVVVLVVCATKQHALPFRSDRLDYYILVDAAPKRRIAQPLRNRRRPTTTTYKTRHES
jgi:hypothetical protein